MRSFTFKDRQQIRKNYLKWKPKCDPYKFWDWANYFTPIENNVWEDIRYLNLPFYPQFPVGRFFVDFADPVKKICIEVDGKYHIRNKYRDIRRQRIIEQLGWTVYRIEGRETYKTWGDFFDNDFWNSDDKHIQLQIELFKKSSEGILKEISNEIYGRRL